MTRWHRTHRGLAASLLPFLAATLACAGLGGPGGTPNAALTQAAAATQVAATLPLPTALGSPSAAPPTEAATTAASADTPAASGPTINPCDLITLADAQPLVGGPTLGAGQYEDNSCLLTDNSDTAAVALFALPPEQAQDFVSLYVPVRMTNHVTVEPGITDKAAQDAAAGDNAAVVNDLVAMTSGAPDHHVEKLDGIGQAALWFWQPADLQQEGALIAGQPGALVALVVTGSSTTKESDDQPLMEAIVRRVLSQLPASFTLPVSP